MGESFQNVDNYPRVLEFAAIMYNGNHRIQTLHSLIKPISYNIPDEAERIHGISTEYAMKNGIHFSEYADSLRFMIFDADVVVAHNIEFEVLTIFAEMYRNGFLHRQHGSLYAGLDTICTMNSTAGLLELPKSEKHTYDSEYKYPTLSELHTFLFGTDYAGKHSAYNDTEALAKCFFELTERQPLMYHA